MLTITQTFYLVVIFLSAVVGGFLPLAKPDAVKSSDGFPRGEAFASGVFLALSLLMMLPSAFSGNSGSGHQTRFGVFSVVWGSR